MPVRSFAISFSAVTSLLLIAACSKPAAEFAAGEACKSEGFVVEDTFDGARRGVCEVFADGKVRLNIVPEDPGQINNSPWYAFRLVPESAGTATVQIRYHGGDHRYQPKLSDNGSDWRALEEDRFHEPWFGSTVTLDLELQNQPLWVSAQELVLPDDMHAWIGSVSEASNIERSLLGKSSGGVPIERMDINPESPEVVFLVGRQHPPELTGAIGFFAFYEAILADNELANAFRERFHIVTIPMLNPDGAKAGHWRHNLNGVDLNRDWGPFSQPETQLIEQLLDELDSQQKQVLVSVDFHSTARNVIYTQEDEDLTDPVGFSRQWITAAMERLPDFDFSEQPRPTSDLATSRNYMYKRYGIPAVTYEVADEEDRDTIRHAAAVFAEEFMRLLNETPAKSAALPTTHSRQL